jgi:hypothetical protein
MHVSLRLEGEEERTSSQPVHGGVAVGGGVAVRVIPVPSLNAAPQTEPQLMARVESRMRVSGVVPALITSNSIDVAGLHEMVSKVVAITFWSSADIVLVPQETAVANPVFGSTVATYLLLESHVTAAGPFCVPSLVVSCATNSVVCPI